MLPEVKLRLGNDGRDIRGVLEGINARIKQRGNDDNEDMLLVNGTDIRTSTYVPYGSPNNGEINLSFNNGSVSNSGFKVVSNQLKDINEYNTPDGYTYIDDMNRVQGGIHDSEVIQTMSSENQQVGVAVNSVLSSINNTIKTLGSGGRVNHLNKSYVRSSSPLPDLANGTYVYTNYMSKMNAANKNYYNSVYNPNFVDKSLANDYMRDGNHSLQQLGGMYGFLAGQMFGETS